MAVHEIARRLIGNVWTTVDANETSAGWAVREIVNGDPINVGRTGNSIVLNPEGDTLYVGSSEGFVTLIDLATETASDEITVAADQPIQALVFSPDGATLYAAVINGTVVPIDVATATAGAPIELAQLDSGPVDLAITPDGAKLYVSNGNDGTVTPINTETATPGTPIEVGDAPKALSMRPNGETVYVANHSDDTVQAIDVETDTAGAVVAVGTQPWGLKVSPDGTSLYVTNWGDDTIQVINLDTFTAGAPLVVGSGGQSPIAFALTADGSLLYVCHEFGGTVPVATATLVLEPELNIGSANTSNWLALSADERKLYVLHASGFGIDYVVMTTLTLDDVVGGLYHLASV